MDDCRPHLLFLCHRIPFPPDKGDKIRSFRWWLALVEHFRVHLGAFVDDPADWSHVPELEEKCASSLFLALPPTRARIRSAFGLFSGTALTFPYYRDGRMQRWVDACLATFGIDRVLVFSAAMAQYVESVGWSAAWRVVDFVDVDSDKWRQYAQSAPWPMRWLYLREADRLAVAEARLAGVFDASVFVSEHEAELFRGRVGSVADRVCAIGNGVDCGYFDGGQERTSPFPLSCVPVVFTGAMDYRANVDAVVWFVRDIWPRVLAKQPRAQFWIVGARPVPSVEALRCGDVSVTGWVPDVRPYLQHAAAVVAPLRMARGIQNKVLEGMAMGRPVVVTSKGLEGIDATPGLELLVADDPASFADEVLSLLSGRFSGIGSVGRLGVSERYDWAKSTRSLIELVQGRGVRTLGSDAATAHHTR